VPWHKKAVTAKPPHSHMNDGNRIDSQIRGSKSESSDSELN
jgi:hypothetical protein